MNSISANELKTKGVSIVENVLQNEDEAIITVRGKQKYVIIDLKNIAKCGNMSWKSHYLKPEPILLKGIQKRKVLLIT